MIRVAAIPYSGLLEKQQVQHSVPVVELTDLDRRKRRHQRRIWDEGMLRIRDIRAETIRTEAFPKPVPEAQPLPFADLVVETAQPFQRERLGTPLTSNIQARTERTHGGVVHHSRTQRRIRGELLIQSDRLRIHRPGVCRVGRGSREPDDYAGIPVLHADSGSAAHFDRVVRREHVVDRLRELASRPHCDAPHSESGDVEAVLGTQHCLDHTRVIDISEFLVPGAHHGLDDPRVVDVEFLVSGTRIAQRRRRRVGGLVGLGAIQRPQQRGPQLGARIADNPVHQVGDGLAL